MMLDALLHTSPAAYLAAGIVAWHLVSAPYTYRELMRSWRNEKSPNDPYGDDQTDQGQI